MATPTVRDVLLSLNPANAVGPIQCVAAETTRSRASAKRSGQYMMRTERATSVLRLAGEPVSPIALPAGQKAMAALLTLALWSRADGLVRVMSASPVE